MTNSFARVAALLTLLMVTQYVASANVRVRPSDSTVVKADPAVKAVKAPLTVASVALPAKVQQKVVETAQVEKAIETVPKEKVAEKPVAVQQPSVAELPKVTEDETKLVEDKKTSELEAGHNIQGDGPFVVNTQQLPADVREEIMRQLNTQYRISQEKKLQRKQPVNEQIAQVKSDESLTSEDESFDPELAAGIAELLTRMAVEDDVGNQYVDLEELPIGLRTQVSDYLMKEQKMEEEKEIEQQLKMQQQAEITKEQEANINSFLSKQTGSQIDEILSSLMGGALADYPAASPGAGYYPQRSGSYGSPQRPTYSTGYPRFGGYSQFAGYPGGSRYQPASFRPYSAVAAYPYAALGGYYPVSHSNRFYRPQNNLMAREQLADLYGAPVGPSPSLYRMSGGQMAGPQMVPVSYRADLKPEDQPTPLAAFYAYYRQQYESQAKPARRTYPSGFAVQQPRPYVNYNFRRYFE